MPAVTRNGGYMNYGEVISLGRHRLMCGDATRREDVMKLIGEDRVDLVLTDPPYGIKIFHSDGKIGGNGRSVLMPRHKNSVFLEAKMHIPFKDDKREAAKKHYEIVRELTEHQIIWGGSYFTDFYPFLEAGYSGIRTDTD